MIKTQRVSNDKQCRVNCSTVLYVLFEVTFIVLRDPKRKYIYFLYLITYIQSAAV